VNPNVIFAKDEEGEGVSMEVKKKKKSSLEGDQGGVMANG